MAAYLLLLLERLRVGPFWNKREAGTINVPSWFSPLSSLL